MITHRCAIAAWRCGDKSSLISLGSNLKDYNCSYPFFQIQLLSVSAEPSVLTTGNSTLRPYDALGQRLTWQTSWTAVGCRAAGTSLFDKGA